MQLHTLFIVAKIRWHIYVSSVQLFKVIEVDEEQKLKRKLFHN